MSNTLYPQRRWDEIARTPLPESWRHDMTDMVDRLAEIDRLIKELRRVAW